MRIRIDHATTYSYEQPTRFIIQALRMTPRSGDGQHIYDWRIETDVDARLRRSEDAHGNIVHTLYTERPTTSLTVHVAGEVSTSCTSGVFTGDERLSPLIYLRGTPLTACDGGMRAFADAIPAMARLDRLHALMLGLHGSIAYDVGATAATHTAIEAFEIKRGVCQDHAHLFIAMARHWGVPARYVSGHLVRADGQETQDAAHAWAEAYVEGLGWVGFDAANGMCPSESYVRVACGLDYLGAAPVRGASYGGGAEALSVRLNVRDTQAPRQQQA